MNTDHINKYLLKTKIRTNSTQRIFRFENNFGVYVTTETREPHEKVKFTEISVAKINSDKTITQEALVIEYLSDQEVFDILRNIKNWEGKRDND